MQGVVTSSKEKERTSGRHKSARFILRNEGLILNAVWRNIPLGFHGDHLKTYVRIYRYYWLTFWSMKFIYIVF